MGETEYSEALKLGKKEYRARIAKGQFPYLPVLDEILSEADIQTEQNMRSEEHRLRPGRTFPDRLFQDYHAQLHLS